MTIRASILAYPIGPASWAIVILGFAGCGGSSVPEPTTPEPSATATAESANSDEPPCGSPTCEPDDAPPHNAADDYRVACAERHDAAACTSLGEVSVELVDSDVTAAVRDLRIACDGGVQRSCHNLGVVLMGGELGLPNYGYPQDLPTARRLLTHACDSGYEGSCINAAAMLAAGMGGPEDLETSLTLATRLCSAGDPDAYACHLKDEVLRVQAARAAANTPAGPRYSTTIGELTVNGGTFRNIGASCGMFELMGVFQGIRSRVRRCVQGERTATVTMTLQSGRVTAVTGESDPGSTCATRALQRAQLGTATCDLRVTIVD